MSQSESTVGGGRTKYKIIFLGDTSVGKSSIIQKYLKDKFQQGLNPTVGIDFHIKNVSRSGRQYRIQLWDTAGQQRFRSLIPNYMKDAICAVFVYDVNKKQTLENISFWNHMFSQNQLPEAIKVLVGNKTDLADRQVSRKQGEEEGLKYQAKHFDVSAKYGKKIDELFNSIIDLISQSAGNKAELPPIQEYQHKQSMLSVLKPPSQNINSKIELDKSQSNIKKTKFCC